MPRSFTAACSLARLLFCASIFGCSRLAFASDGIIVDPRTGFDSEACGTPPAAPCKTITFAVNSIGATLVILSADVFNETKISVTSVASLVVSGVPSQTVFDCSRRPGPAFNIVNSTVSIAGIAFHACSNPRAPGGAVSASDSSVVVSQCSFINCSATSGGAISVSGLSSSLYLSVRSSVFTGNSANAGSAGCPADESQPCSTWGGAVAVFEMSNVTISGCRMVNNTAQASLLRQQSLAGGGCVSVLYSNGNAVYPTVRVIDSTFLQCTSIVTLGGGPHNGNGMAAWCMC